MWLVFFKIRMPWPFARDVKRFKVGTLVHQKRLHEQIVYVDTTFLFGIGHGALHEGGNRLSRALARAELQDRKGVADRLATHEVGYEPYLTRRDSYVTNDLLSIA